MNAVSDYVKEREANIEKVANIRINDSYKARLHEYRSDADVDFSRVIYSSAYRRLQGKMQLFIPKAEVFYRNRLTHSHEVAQIAKTIARKLGMRDTLTVQTASLAHDIGNPPFGHAGEVFLSGRSNEPYEGNAQTYRVLRYVEERHHDFHGLNLTLRTMMSIVKYFRSYEEDKKKFLYDGDFEEVKKWIDDYGLHTKSIDCEVMDIADEIAYAVHDLDDALKLKYFTIDELHYEFLINQEYGKVAEVFQKIIYEAADFARKAHAYETSEEYAMLFRKELTSILVNRFVADITVTDKGIDYHQLGDLCLGLKKLTFEAIKRQPDIIEYELLGKHVLESLYGLYDDDTFNKNLILLPANYRIPSFKSRMILDYLGGMTDLFAFVQYEKYFGPLKDRGLYFP